MTDGRYRTQAVEQLAAAGLEADVDVAIGGVPAQREALAAAAAGLAVVGLEADQVTWSQKQSWAGAARPGRLWRRPGAWSSASGW